LHSALHTAVHPALHVLLCSCRSRQRASEGGGEKESSMATHLSLLFVFGLLRPIYTVFTHDALIEIKGAIPHPDDIVIAL
jgi:hypothetical protein